MLPCKSYRDVVFVALFLTPFSLRLLVRLPKDAAFVAKYRAPLGTLRHLLHTAITDWVNEQVTQFAHSVSDFASPADHLHQAHHSSWCGIRYEGTYFRCARSLSERSSCRNCS